MLRRRIIRSPIAASMVLLCLTYTSGCGVALKNTAAPANSQNTTNIPLQVSVASFGAIGDGDNDDTTAISRALRYIVSQGGGIVTIPCGTYLIDTVNPSVAGARSLLYVKNATNVTLQGKGSCSSILTRVPHVSLIEFEDSSDISILDMHLTAVNTPYVEKFGWNGGSAIRFSGVSKGLIKSIEIDGSSAGAIYLTKGSSGVVVSNNYIHDTEGSAIWEDDCSTASQWSCAPSSPPYRNVIQANQIVDSSLDMLTAISLDDGNATTNTIVDDNQISWTTKVIAAPHVHCIQVGDVSHATISNNSCTNTPWDAIAVVTGVNGVTSNVTIAGNTLTNSGTHPSEGSGVVVYAGQQSREIDDIKVIDNVVDIASDDGIRLATPGSDRSINGVSITGNVVHDSDHREPGSHSGIYIKNGVNVIVNGNVISGDSMYIADGVRVDPVGDSISLEGNTVKDILGIPYSVQ